MVEKMIFDEEEQYDDFGVKPYDGASSDIMGDYLNSIKDISVLTKEEELALFKEYEKTHSPEVKQTLMLHNQKLIVSIAKKYKSMTFSMDLMNLIMEGNFGLATAIERFDINVGTKFSTYATHWIKQAITRSIDNNDKLVRVPVHLSALLRKYYNYTTEYIEVNKRKPSDKEVMKALKINSLQLKELRKINTVNMGSLNEKVGESEEEEFLDFIADDSINMSKNIEAEELRNFVDKIIDELWKGDSNYERNKDIVYKRFGLMTEKTTTLSTLGVKYDVTRERVRQIEIRFLRECRKPKNKVVFAQFM